MPWWNEECDTAVKTRRSSFKKAKLTRNLSDCLKYQECKARARKVINNAKNSTWQGFCSSVTKDTKLGKVWRIIKKMQGLGGGVKVPTLRKGDDIATANIDKANMLAAQFAKVSSNANFSDTFQAHRRVFEEEQKSILTDKCDVQSPLNEDFTLPELRRAIKQCRDTSPGADNVCYSMFRKMPTVCMYVVLSLFNAIWAKGVLPKSWKHSIVTPLVKPGKPSFLPESFRPIALTSNLSKIMEKLINNRLLWYLEKEGKLNNIQCAFRKRRCTNDHLIRLHDSVYKSVNNKRSVLAVFIDIEKAYDMVWRQGLMFKLYHLGIRGKMFWWIRDFLSNRTFLVRIGNTLSDVLTLENGIPQGSVISPILFNVMINDISVSDNSCYVSLFADDCAVWLKGSNTKYMCTKMQKVLNELDDWSGKWGFKFSISKTKAVLFTRKLKPALLDLSLNDSVIEFVTEFKFLGIIFDAKLSWSKHIDYVVKK